MSAEGVLTITALFQDNASPGLQSLNTQLTATSSAASQAESGFTPLNNALGTTSTEASTTANAFTPLGSSVQTSATAAENAVPGFVGMGNALGSTGTSARGAVEPMGALNSSFQGVAKGGLDMTNTLQPMPGLMNTGGVAAGGFGTALKQNALAISAVAATAVGLVTGLTSIERAHVMAERSSNTLTAAQIKEQTIQDQLTAAIAKYGPNSEQARVLTEKLALAHQQTAAAADKNSLAQERYDEAIGNFVANFAPQAILLGGGIVQIFSNIEGAGSKLSGAFSSIGSAISSFASAAVQSFTGVGLASDGATTKVGALRAALATIAIPAAIAAAIVAAFFAIGQAIASNSQTVQSFFDTVGNDMPALKTQFTTAGEVIVGFGTYSRDALKMFTDTLGITKNAYTPVIEENSKMVADFVAGNRDMTLSQQNWAKSQLDFAHQHGVTTEQFIANLKKEDEAAAATKATQVQATADMTAAWKAFNDGANTALDSVSTTMKNFTSALVAGIERTTGVIPELSQAFGTEAAHIVEFEGQITAGMKAMEKNGFSTAAIVSFGATTVAALQNVKQAAISAGGVMKTDWIAANQLAQQVAAGHTEKLGQLEQAVQKLGNDFQTAAQTSQAEIGSLKNLSDGAALAGTSMTNLGSITKSNTEIMSSAFVKVAQGMDADKTKMAEWILVNSNVKDASGNTALALRAQGDVYGILTQAQDKDIQAGAQWIVDKKSEAEIAKMSAGEILKTALAHKDYVPAAAASKKATEDFNTALNAELVSLSDSISKEELTTAATMKFANAQGFAAKGIADAAKSYADALVKYQALTAELSNGTAKQNLYNAAVLEGKDKLLQFELTSQQTAVTDKEYANGLGQVVEKLGFFKSGLEATVQNEELFYKATQGDASAMQELKKQALDLVSGFVQLADQVGNKLGQAMEKGHKEFSKAIKDLEAETGIKFDEHQVFLLSLQGEMDNAKTSLQADVDSLAAMIIQGGATEVGPAGAKMMEALNTQMKGVSPQLIGTFTKVIQDIQTIANKGVTLGGLQQLKTDMAAVGIPADKLEAVIASLGIKVAGTAPAFTKLSAAAQLVATNFKTMGDTVNTSTGEVTNAAGQIIGKIDLTTGAFTKYSAGVSAAVDLNTGFARGVDDAAGSLNKLKLYTDTVFTLMLPSINKAAVAMNQTFAKAVQDAAGSLNNLQLKVNAVFDAILKTINTDMASAATDVATQVGKMLSAVNTDFGAIEKNINTDMVGAANDVKTQTNSMLSQVNNIFGAIQRNINTDMAGAARDVATHGSAIISEFGRIGSAASSAASQVRSLASSISALHDKTVTITTRYVTQGTPVASPTTNTNSTPYYTGTATPSPTTNLVSYTTTPYTTALSGGGSVTPSPTTNPTLTVNLVVDGQTLARVTKKNIFNLSGGTT